MELFAPPPNLPAVWKHLSAKGVAKTDEDGLIRIVGGRSLILDEREEAFARIGAFSF